MFKKHNNHYDYSFQLFLVGDSGVGKTMLFRRYIQESFIFIETLLKTIGIDKKSKEINLEGKKILLNIMDLSATNNLMNFIKGHYKVCHGVILIYDVSYGKSFENIREWMKGIEENASNDCIKILVGNKCDKTDREISELEGLKLANKYNICFLETSAKTGENVDEIFNLAVKKMLDVEMKKALQKYEEKEKKTFMNLFFKKNKEKIKHPNEKNEIKDNNKIPDNKNEIKDDNKIPDDKIDIKVNNKNNEDNEKINIENESLKKEINNEKNKNILFEGKLNSI